jgi:hypothetical protein
MLSLRLWTALLCASSLAQGRFIAAPQDALAPRQEPAPIFMIVGDSISQGRNRDYTWRYRLWQWFQANSIPVTLVGPYTGTVEQTVGPEIKPPPTFFPVILPVHEKGGYAADVDPAFVANGSAHFAAWGRALMQDIDEVYNMVARYMPDYLLVELGYNDVTWMGSNATDLQKLMVDFITSARNAVGAISHDRTLPR